MCQNNIKVKQTFKLLGYKINSWSSWAGTPVNFDRNEKSKCDLEEMWLHTMLVLSQSYSKYCLARFYLLSCFTFYKFFSGFSSINSNSCSWPAGFSRVFTEGCNAHFGNCKKSTLVNEPIYCICSRHDLVDIVLVQFVNIKLVEIFPISALQKVLLHISTSNCRLSMCCSLNLHFPCVQLTFLTRVVSWEGTLHSFFVFST